MMGRIVVTKDAFLSPHIGVRVMDFNGMPQFCAYDLVQVEKTFVPKQNPASDKTVEVIRCQASDLIMNLRPLDPAQTSFDA